MQWEATRQDVEWMCTPAPLSAAAEMEETGQPSVVSSKRKQDLSVGNSKRMKFNDSIARDKVKVKEHVEEMAIKQNKLFGKADSKRNEFVK